MQRGHSLLWCRCRVISFLTHEAPAAQSVIKGPPTSSHSPPIAGAEAEANQEACVMGDGHFMSRVRVIRAAG